MEKFSAIRKGAIAALSTVFCISLGVACATFGARGTVANAETNAVTGMNLVLTDSIAAQYQVDKSVVGENAYLTVEFNGSTQTITDYSVSGDVLTYEFTGITPQYMTEEMVVTAYTSSGDAVGTLTKSVQDYCASLLAKTAGELGYGEEKYSAMVTLVNDLLNYGTSAQNYKGANVDNLANSILVDPVYGAILPAQSNKISSVNGEEATKDAAVPVAVGMELDYNINMVFKYNLSNVENPVITLSADGEAVEASAYTVSSGEWVTAGGNAYNTVIKYGVAACTLDSVIKVSVSDGETPVGCSVEYSAADYVYSKMNGEAQGDLVKKMYVYGTSAKAYADALKLTSHKIVLNGGYFDGDTTKTSIIVDAGENINTTAALTEEYEKQDMHLDGWYMGYGYYFGANLSGLSEKLGGQIKNDVIDLYPIYESDKIMDSAENGTYGSGKLKMSGGNRNYRYAVDAEGNDIKSATINESCAYNNHRIIFANNTAERADLIRSYNALASGTRFALHYDATWKGAGTTTFTVTYKNVGSCAVKFTTFLSTGGTSASAADGSKTAGSDLTWELAVGEIKTQTFTTAIGHNCVIINYTIEEDTTSRLDLLNTVYLDYSKTLTIDSEYYSFAGGAASVNVDYKTSAPEIVSVKSLPTGRELIGWQIKGNTSTTYAADLSDFTMPNTATVLVPVLSGTMTLTLQSAKFANGTSTTQLEVGSALPSGIVADEIEGKKRYGWVNVNTGVYYTDETFVMPNEATIIAAVYDYTDETAFLKRESQPINNGSNGGIDYKLTMRYGKVQLYPDNANMTVKNVTGFSSNPDGRAKGAVKLSDGTYELSSYIGSASGVNNTYAVTYFSQYQNWTALGDGAKRKAAFTFTNYGSEDISFEVMISSASGNPTGSVYDKLTITVKAGETYEADMDLGTNGKDSIILHFAFTSEASELSLAYNFSILKVEE